MNLESEGASAPLVDQLEEWLRAVEGEHCEFKEAKSSYSFEKLTEYCCALANEGGGRMILGVTNRRPRRIVGTKVFQHPEDTCRTLMEHLHLRIHFREIAHRDGRVLVFEVPSRPAGTGVKYKGVYWSREGDSLVPMSEDKLRNIFAEAGHDFSADICKGAAIEDLDTQAVEDFRRRWIEKSKNDSLASLSQDQLLRDAEVLVDDRVTYAALILFGTRRTLGKYLEQGEVVFEYRSSDASGPAQQRKEYRHGFFGFYDDLWSIINLRNDLQQYQDGLFVFDVPTFAERPVREAILNAVSHRDYQLGGSVFVRQYPRRLVVESPGGFPVGITVDNILDRQSPRNRRIADVFAKCGLVERSGQGMNLMFEQSIQQGKPRPAFAGTDAYGVVLTLHGQVQDPNFVRFLQKVGRETTASFGTHDFLVLDLVHREETVPPGLQHSLRNLKERGVVESIGRGRGTRYVLCRRFYVMAGRKGVYTRKRGLDRNTNRALLLKHIEENIRDGCSLNELTQVLPGVSGSYIQGLLRELRAEGRTKLEGSRRWARWYPGGEPKVERKA
ncbi:MAG: putative DNA binding domain-containing protein [Candidatus Eisenbacteria bacterium]|nr:putative DNA binding domain-containing protein [Candidatus Eisenbacteria bacterium]